MAIVSSIAELQREMMRQVKSAMKAESDWLVDYTKDVVQKTVYDVYEPVQGGYERTGQLKDSIDITQTKDSGTSYSMTVGHNLKGVYWHSVKDYRKVGVPYIVHYGKTGSYPRKKIYGGAVGYDQHGNYPTYHNIDPSGKIYGRRRPYMDNTVKALQTSGLYLRKIATNLGSSVTVI